MAGMHVTGTEKKSGECKIYDYGIGLRKRNKLKIKLKTNLKKKEKRKNDENNRNNNCTYYTKNKFENCINRRNE